jgi:lipopolysaccharide transport system ATP-binding protein
MSDIAISIQQLSKKYEIGAAASGSLRDTITNGFKSLLRLSKQEEKIFWALKDVSFDIRRGEVLGIVGRNGAGKSTLLKILSRITEPSSGKIELFGRVTSLLEVGTGFHPELTGRENIFLNGSILGMTRQEIRRKFDEIVAFSGVEKFLDTPVKHYSSGMYVRLAFAVAAHLEAEILIIDEVLAVGDAEFQRKCLGKMNEVAKSGRTVIFVSHNLGAVRSLCKSCCLLQQGQMIMTGAPDAVIQTYYLNNLEEKTGFQRDITSCKNQHLSIRPTQLTIIIDDEPNGFMQVGQRLAFDVAFEADAPTRQIYISILISSTSFGDFILSSTLFLPIYTFPQASRSGKVRVNFGKLPLIAGQYTVAFWIGKDVNNFEHLPDAITFEVQEKNIWGTINNPPRVCPMWWATDYELIEGNQ